MGNSGDKRFLPDGEPSLPALREAARRCQGCSLYRNATQTVFGTGPPDATFMFVGEQPGDQEDRQGAPFVGPAGRVLARAIEEAGIDRDRVYLTNAVKHFKFQTRGKRRIHERPSAAEIAACRPWLTAELRVVDPVVTVVLGATAARALLGPAFRVTRRRGEPIPRGVGSYYVATIHPSAVLRAPSGQRGPAYEGFLADVRVAARLGGR
ncbi:uracil-DNA glycosylase [Thermobispora bispora]|jgi:uracil-DNA glycosylase|uniref:Type-4 uracil-DNA glycosylase n=1 Tax=Thermobispora bispora (strain ATCC 19993 / DSM 43833 / CBS 139.67 / JCM 10125 / KCTC 9307 / NBRC 14880 / R51) TaxID=469371 RepID=D6Y4X4_THEBD|nr:UdgX family uracil-DNA binding protein [Thermobispora bispora]MBO2475179.1 uracil-DNA glycosylase [Actinomycetales bacterium]MDI9581818.1 UdgX family uracil-DNA binding protein [Thermobispora sp.]ADG87249.1 phage SPO1 DNA polymerase-related protein [Thermobispora bispora DSM 43833]MBX6166145.1 UdgX family uracil-DNA binding protein [Thermobispora bispora]QSI47202.1 uracil-DNA glycosylase [Thermobispora bispora]